MSSGKLARAVCDRCGLAFNYPEIRTEADTQLRVCETCQDGPDPYRRLVRKSDDLSIPYPRPDTDISV